MLYDSTPLSQPIAPPPIPAESPRPIAHWSHTLAVILFLVAFAIVGHSHATSSAETAPRLTRYFSSLTLEWLLLGSVVAGIYRRREFFVAAFVPRARSVAATLGLGLAVYCLGFAVIASVGGVLYFTPLFHKRNEAVVLAMLPHTGLEFLVWFFVSLTAGVCEELIFRGYLLQQLTSWLKSPIAAIIVAGTLFGCIHLYEGIAAIAPLGALGITYGLVVRHYKGDLRMVIVAHTLQDFLVALLALARPFIESHRPHP